MEGGKSKFPNPNFPFSPFFFFLILPSVTLLPNPTMSSQAESSRQSFHYSSMASGNAQGNPPKRIVYCDCKFKLELFKSYTVTNPNRRFLRCPLYADKKATCGHFEWVDPSEAQPSTRVYESHICKTCEEYEKKVKKMKKKISAYQNELYKLRITCVSLIVIVFVVLALWLKS